MGGNSLLCSKCYRSKILSFRSRKRKSALDHENTCSKAREPHGMEGFRRMEMPLSDNSLGSSGSPVEGGNTGWVGRFGMLREGQI